MSEEVETVVVDVGGGADLPLEALHAELHNLRACLAGEAEKAERDGEAAERRGSEFWFASWKNGNRQRQELLREIDRLRRDIDRLQRMARAAVIAICNGAGAAEIDALSNEVGAAAPGRSRA